MGLAGIDVEQATSRVAEHHTEVHALPGRDLSRVVSGAASQASVAEPVYFMTDDDISCGLSQANPLSGEPFAAVEFPSHVESVIATLPTGVDGAVELWKLIPAPAD